MGFCPPCQIKQWAFVQWAIVQWAFVLVGFCPSGLLSVPRNNRLPIEIGRWANIDRSLRKCNLCNSGTVGDEFHYVLECCFFDFDRKIFLPHIKRKPVNCFTYANIFNDTNFRRLRRLCNFLKIVIDTFRSRPR